jgi:hypothetical protein
MIWIVVAAVRRRRGSAGAAGRQSLRTRPESDAPVVSAQSCLTLTRTLAVEPPAAALIVVVSMPVK